MRVEIEVEETRQGVMLSVEPPHPDSFYEEVVIVFDGLWTISLFEGGLRVEHDATGVEYESEWGTDWDTLERENAEQDA